MYFLFLEDSVIIQISRFMKYSGQNLASIFLIMIRFFNLPIVGIEGWKIITNNHTYSDRKTSIIHVALSIGDLTDDYNRHAAVTILSLLDNCDKGRFVVFHLLHDEGLINGNEEKARKNIVRYHKLIRDYNAEIIFHNITANDKFKEIPAINTFTINSIFRLYLPELLPDVGKIIYLDCDVVVNADISELYDININEFPIAVVKRGISTMPFGWKRYYLSIGLTVDDLFNSGILIFNLERIRENHSLVPEALSFLSQHRNTPFPDQDFLIWTFRGECFWLDGRYNYYPQSMEKDDVSSNAIIHYRSANNKPWKSYSGSIDDFNWEYFVKTPWADDLLDVVSYGRGSPGKDKFIYSIPSWIYREPIRIQINYIIYLSVGLWVNLMKRYIREILRRL